jgi:hypothetical protein
VPVEVDECRVADEQREAGLRVTTRHQHALGTVQWRPELGLDPVRAAAEIGRGGDG